MIPLTSLTSLTLVTLSLSLPRLACPAKTIPFRTKKVLHVEYVENCEDKVYPFQYRRWTFVRNRTQLIISGEEVVSRDIKDPLALHYRIEKCRDKSNPDTCEYYNTWKFENLCPTLSMLPFVTQIYSLHSPRMTCPFKKGHYYLKDAVFDDFSLTKFLTTADGSRVMYKFRMQMLEKDKEFGCLSFGLSVPSIRVKN